MPTWHGSSSAFPKGSLQDATIQLFARAGFNIYVEPALVLSRRSTIPRSSAC